jgi:hypothetical protein
VGLRRSGQLDPLLKVEIDEDADQVDQFHTLRALIDPPFSLVVLQPDISSGLEVKYRR